MQRAKQQSGYVGKSIFATSVAAGALFGALLSAPSAAVATTYTESITNNPANLVCHIAGGIKTCANDTVFLNPGVPQSGGGGVYNGGSGPILNNGSGPAIIDLTYTTPLVVPYSSTLSLVFIDLYTFVPATGNYFLPNGPVFVQSVVTNYIGPANPFSIYQSADYSAALGFNQFAGNPGSFSITGMTSGFSNIPNNGDLSVFAVYGYQVGVPEPATWAMMLTGVAAIGGALRMRRRNVAAAVTA